LLLNVSLSFNICLSTLGSSRKIDHIERPLIMPSTIVPNSTASTVSPNPSSRQATGTFTGQVYMDSVHVNKEEGVMLNHVTFLPGARTYWHTHERGQILEVKAGSGWICDKGGKPRRIRTGDTVVCAAGTTHWHGADEGSMMMHLAISLGTTSWDVEVTQEEYNQKSA
jgi:quercetin dioxygenase-like cupin family protein